MREDRNYATVVAFFAAFLYLAILVAAFGLISLYWNIDVIDVPDAGPLVGPVMVGCATIAVLISLVVRGRSVPSDEQRIAPLTALLVGVIAYVVFVLSGGIAYAVGGSEPLGFLTFSFHMFASWFSVATGIAGAVVAFVYQLVLVGRFQQRGRPRWPWEHDDKE
jgi:small neutral amino acid transporter SnatA (MarC family)